MDNKKNIILLIILILVILFSISLLYNFYLINKINDVDLLYFAKYKTPPIPSNKIDSIWSSFRGADTLTQQEFFKNQKIEHKSFYVSSNKNNQDDCYNGFKNQGIGVSVNPKTNEPLIYCSIIQIEKESGKLEANRYSN